VRRKPPTVDDFVVLLLDDIESHRTDFRKLLEEIDGVYVVEAEDPDQAATQMDRHHIDAAIVDLMLNGVPTAGYGVIEELAMRAPNAPVVVPTNHPSDELLKFVGSNQIVRVLNKDLEPSSQVVPPIAKAVKRWRARRVNVDEARMVRELVWKRRGRGAYQLRSSKRELDRELERIYRALFGGVRGLEKDAEVHVTMRPIEREGLSAAVTVEGEVTMGRDADGEPVGGNRCVIKIGPRKLIEEEVERYEGFVKFGVRMAQRVELLNYAYESQLGAVTYSFAGGVFGQSLMSFDQLLRRPDGRQMVATAIEELFDPEQKAWYGVHCTETSPSDYMGSTYHADFAACFKRLGKSLGTLQGKLKRAGLVLTESRRDEPGSFVFPGGRLDIPPLNVTGEDPVYTRRPACLVHGDMHGGNVMIELSAVGAASSNGGDTADLRKASLKRICLIDYRSAGPGPRAVDAVALQASIRLADAAAISEEVAPGVPERKLKGKALEKAVIRAANRVQAEQKLLNTTWAGGPADVPTPNNRSAPWASASALLAARMRLTFEDMSLDEYLSIAIPCVIRQFGYDVGTLARVRLLAWLSALYGAAMRAEAG
jgi:DNA-binding NarL/FixJ family response regulator